MLVEMRPRFAGAPVQPALVVFAAALPVGVATRIANAYVFVILTLSGRVAPG